VGNTEKSAKILILALQKRSASPEGTASAHRFTYKHRMQHSANNVSLERLYSWRYVACSASHIFPELAYKLASTERKQK
jgi:hypothetical protein